MKHLMYLLFIACTGWSFAAVSGGPQLAETHACAAEELLPPSTFKVLKKQDNLTTFVRLLEVTGIDKTLDGKKAYTVFAPTDAAFAQLMSPQELEMMLEIEDRSGVRSLLEAHIYQGRLTTDAMDAGASASTLQVESLSGKILNINATGEGYMVNNAQIIESDIGTKNGVIHLVDAMIVVD